jgi:hypothetical protein
MRTDGSLFKWVQSSDHAGAATFVGGHADGLEQGRHSGKRGAADESNADVPEGASGVSCGVDDDSGLSRPEEGVGIIRLDRQCGPGT